MKVMREPALARQPDQARVDRRRAVVEQHVDACGLEAPQQLAELLVADVGLEGLAGCRTRRRNSVARRGTFLEVLAVASESACRKPTRFSPVLTP